MDVLGTKNMKLLQLFSGMRHFSEKNMRTFRTKLKLLQDCSKCSTSNTYSYNKKNNFKLNIIEVSKNMRTFRTGDNRIF